MPERTYAEQISNQAGAIDLDFWRNPEGIAVPDNFIA